MFILLPHLESESSTVGPTWRGLTQTPSRYPPSRYTAASMTIHRYATSLFLSFTYSNNVMLDLCHFVMAQCRCCGEPSTTLNLLHLRTPFRLHKCPAGTSSSHGGLSHLLPSHYVVSIIWMCPVLDHRLTSPAVLYTGCMKTKARASET